MRFLIYAAMVVLVFGCESARRNAISITGAQFPIEGEPLEQIDLVNMIDPENRRSRLGNHYCRSGGAIDTDDFESTELQCAVAAFETYFMTNIEFTHYLRTLGSAGGAGESVGVKVDEYGLPRGIGDEFQRRKATSYALALRRNEIQDAIMRHSDEYCRVFQEDLSDTRSLFQMTTGGLSTTLGGLGAIFTNANVARALAGAAGITSGLNAEFESAFFQQQALSTIYAGISLRRTRIADAIGERRFRLLDDTLRGPHLTVVASLMKNGRIHDGAVEIPSRDIAATSPDDNMLYVVSFNADAPPLQDGKKDAGDADSETKNGAVENSAGPVALVSVANYTLERAIGDSLIYHQACTLTEGLIEAEHSITSFEHQTRVRGTAVGADVIDEINSQRGKLPKAATGGPAK